MKKNHLDTLYAVGTNIVNLGELSFWGRLLYKKRLDSIKNLSELSIGAVADIGHAKLPSQIIDIIMKDLNIKYISENDQCKLYCYWKKQLDLITKQFSDLERVQIPSQYKNEYSRATATIKVMPEVLLIDQISKRMGILWDQASKLKWSEVLLMQRIDRQNALFEYYVMEKNKARK